MTNERPNPPPLIPPVIRNQSLVKFQYGSYQGSSYSNNCYTPITGPYICLEKCAEEHEVALGCRLTYKLEITNTGNRAAHVTVFDDLPEGLAFVTNSVLRDGVPIPGASPVKGIGLGHVNMNEKIVITFQCVVVAIPRNLLLCNEATAKMIFHSQGRTVETFVRSNTVKTRVIAVLVSARLEVNTQESYIGDSLTYTVHVRNEGTEVITHLQAAINVPAQTSFVPGSVAIGDVLNPSATPNQPIPLGRLSPGAAVALNYRVQIIDAPPGFFIDNVAVVTYTADGVADKLVTNNVLVTVYQPQLVMKLTCLQRVTTADARVSYDLVLNNEGNVAVDAVLFDFLPAGTLLVLDRVDMNGSQLAGIQPSQGLPLGTLKAHSDNLLSYQVMVPFTAANMGDSIFCQVLVRYTFRLPDGRTVQQSMHSNESIVPFVLPQIHLQCSVEPLVVEAGDRLRFSVRLSNSGNWAVQVRLQGLLPAGMFDEQASLMLDGIAFPLANENISSLAMSLPLPLLMPGQEVQLTYAAFVDTAVTAKRIAYTVTAFYEYVVNSQAYTREIRSNTCLIVVEDQFE